MVWLSNSGNQEYLGLLAVEMALTKSVALPDMPASCRATKDILAYVLVEMFVGDVTSLVWKGFGRKIEARCQNEDPAIQRLGREQKEAYAEWLALKHPLARNAARSRAGQQNRRGGHNGWELLKAIAGNEAQISGSRWTTEALGRELVEVTKPGSSHRAKAPLVSNGLFFLALPAAQKRLVKPIGYQSHVDMEEALGAALQKALEAHKVEFVPHHEATAGQFHPFAVIQKWWATVAPARAPSERFTLGEEVLAEARRQPREPWDLPEKIEQIKLFTHKEVLPRDWKLEAASLLGLNKEELYVSETYRWVKECYDGSQELHRMALLWSIMFSWIVPQILVPTGRIRLKQTRSPTEATEAVLKIPWEEPPKSRKGFKDRLPFVVMVTCTIIALFEPESPLRKRMAANKNELGPAWIRKHCELHKRCQQGQAMLTKSFFMNAASKGINHVMLIRMGLAVALKEAAIQSPRFESNWTLKDRAEVESLYRQVVAELKEDRPLSLYNAYRLVFGEWLAQDMARRYSFDYLPQQVPL